MFFALFLLAFLLVWGIVYATSPVVRHGIDFIAGRVVRNARVAKFVTTHGERLRDYWPVFATVAAGALLTAWAGDGFLDLAELVHGQSGVLQQTDARWHDWAVTQRTAGATEFFALMATIGGPFGIGAIVLITTIALVIKRRYRWAIYLLVTAAGGGLLDYELKLYFARARPAVAEMLRAAHGYSFPSGHAMGSMVAFGALAYIASRAITPWRWRSAVIALAIVLIVAVASSRVYLGVHWISDIAAGIAAGGVWVTSTTVAYEILRRIRHLRGIRREAYLRRSSSLDGARGE